MTCGSGGVGNASIDTLLKDLRTRLSATGEGTLNHETYTMESVAASVHEFFKEKATGAGFSSFLVLRICGYASGKPLPEVWEVGFDSGTAHDPFCVQKEEDIGLNWNGELEAMNRLLLGTASNLGHGNTGRQGILTEEQFKAALPKPVPHIMEPVIVGAAPIQDAIELARFMVETTKGFIKFAINRPKVVGGATEIAAITKHEGFKWVQRKLFYSKELNP
jgi:hypothetical protein